MSILSSNPKIVYGVGTAGTLTATPSNSGGSLTAAHGIYTFSVCGFSYLTGGTTKFYGTAATATATIAGGTSGSVALSWAAMDGADGYVVTRYDGATPKIVATYESGAWSTGTGTATTFTETGITFGAEIPAATSPITLWLPKKFTKWTPVYTDNGKTTTGLVYTQRQSFPPIYTISAETAVFSATESEDWDGGGAEAFTIPWKAFYDNWASVGKVFAFYRNATDSTAGYSYFNRCVWTLKDNGIKSYIGRLRYSLSLSMTTEAAVR